MLAYLDYVQLWTIPPTERKAPTRCEKFLFAVPRWFVKGWTLNAHHPPWPGCSADSGYMPAAEVNFPEYIFLHSSVEIRHSSTAHHMKSFLFPALCLLTKIRPCTLLLAHTCLLTEQNCKNILILPSHQPYITNSQTLLKQLMF